MSFGPDEHAGYAEYELNFNNTVSEFGFQVRFVVMAEPSGGSTEAERDDEFQAFLDYVAVMPNVVVDSANRNGRFTSPATVTP